MAAAINGVGLGIGLLIYVVSLCFVLWAVVDVARQPRTRLSLGRKVAWLLGTIVGWLIVGFIGGIVALIYLFSVRPRLGTGTGSTSDRLGP